MLQALEDCLNKFCRKDVDPFLRSYLETVISLSYFRVPVFNQMFIECLEMDIDEKIPEWTGMRWDIN